MSKDDLQDDSIREKARKEERHRLAVYLHDSVGQTLCLAKLQLSRIHDALREPFDADRRVWLQTTVDDLIRDMDTAIDAVQEKLYDLNVPTVTDIGLNGGLEQECATFIRRTGIRCHRRFEPLNVDAERSALVLLIVREALSNIARHSGAMNVEVTLKRAMDRGILTVSDDGRGMEPSRIAAHANFGLRGMEERATLLGGDFSLDSTPNEGTRITVAFPLRPGPQNTSLPD